MYVCIPMTSSRNNILLRPYSIRLYDDKFDIRSDNTKIFHNYITFYVFFLKIIFYVWYFDEY